MGKIFFLMWILIVSYILVSFYRGGKKALSIFPELENEKIIYRDKRASGRATTNFRTKIGGAKNVLDIIVTEKELWLKSSLLFAGILKDNDLLFKISLNKIIDVSHNDKVITIDFETNNGDIKQVQLITKQPESFLQALKMSYNG